MRISDWSSDVCSSDLIRVIARAYAEKNDGLRKFLSERYGHVLRDFARAIATCVPELSKEQLYWRLDFLAGALTYAMADFGLIKRPSGVSDTSRSEEHTSELQSLMRISYAVFCLKKNINTTSISTRHYNIQY